MERPAVIHVVAGALADADGRVLIAQRPRGRHMAGRWEFPGGKLAAGEEPLDGLKRELAEELGVSVRAARPLIRLRHDYPDRRVLLDVWQVTDYEGEPQALDAQALAWAKPDDLPQHDLLEANRAIVTALRLASVNADGAMPASLRYGSTGSSRFSAA
jgi:8-oxo-dGTP diphosphatase